MALNEPRLNLPELTVSELSTALKRTIEDAYGYVRVRGELGKVSYHGNGHVYFDLKDERASIAGVIWRSTAPLGEVTTPITAGKNGRSCLRASSNSPSAARSCLRCSSSAISAPSPAGSSVSTTSWYCERFG